MAKHRKISIFQFTANIKECLKKEEIEETKKIGNHRIPTSQKEIRSKVFL